MGKILDKNFQDCQKNLSHRFKEAPQNLRRIKNKTKTQAYQQPVAKSQKQREILKAARGIKDTLLLKDEELNGE